MAGRSPIDAELGRVFAEHAEWKDGGPKEAQVLQLVQQGETLKQIAEPLDKVKKNQASAFFAVAQCKGTIRDVLWLWSLCDDAGMGPLVNELAAVVRTAEANATRRYYADVRR